MKVFFTTSLLLIGSIFQTTQACSCAFFYDNFCQSVTDPNGNMWQDFHIYHVKVMSQEGTGIKVRVYETYFGEVLNGEEIFITSGQGFDCRIGTEGFDVGKEHIFAAWKDSGAYGLSICGLTYLDVVDGMVTGNIAPGITEIPLAEFGELGNCGFLVNPASSQPENIPAVLVQPTLARQDVTLTAVDWDRQSGLKLMVYDAFGRLVYKKRQAQFSTGRSIHIAMQNWGTGVYFFKVEYLERQEVIKIVKVDQ